MMKSICFGRTTALLGLLLAFPVWGCGGGGGGSSSDRGPGNGPVLYYYGQYDAASWPTDFSGIYTTVLSDPANDLILMPPSQAGPPQLVPFAPVDVVSISLGVDGGYLYMRVDYNAVIPTQKIYFPEGGGVEEQEAGNMGMNIALNVDGDTMTGASGEGVWGVEIFFAIGFEFGRDTFAYANYDFPSGDIHLNQQQVTGELGAGGPGHSYVIVRYDTSNLGSFFPAGATVDVGSWSEAESFNLDGSLKYHHFAFDGFTATSWTIPN